MPPTPGDDEAARWIRFFWPIVSMALTTAVVPMVASVIDLKTKVEVMLVRDQAQDAMLKAVQIECREVPGKNYDLIKQLEERLRQAEHRQQEIQACLPQVLRCINGR